MVFGSSFRLLLFFIFILTVQETESQRWYYTGKFQHDTDQPSFFDGQILDHQSFFGHNNNFRIGNLSSQILYCGGLVLTASSPNIGEDGKEILDDREWEFLRNVTLDNYGIKMHQYDVDLSIDIYKLTLISAVRFTINIAKTYADPVVETAQLDDGSTVERVTWPTINAEIGLYDARRGIFVEREWRSLNLGSLVASIVEDAIGRIHKIVWTTDMYNRMSVTQHTWDLRKERVALDNQELEFDVEGSGVNTEEDKSPAKLRVMTYNLWHNNPPSWIYGDKRQRWRRYDSRMRHFAEMIVTSSPDVVTLQEVRLDSSFYSVENKVNYWRNHNFSKVDGGSQIEHLLTHISAAKKRLNSTTDFEYQVIYQPAMSMWERGSLAMRNEEGVMILSRYPVVASKALLLPREVGNPADDHQRIVLIAQLSIDGRLVTVASSHWSLHEPSRNLAVEKIFGALNDEIFAKSSLHILTGDFNAEPHENSVKKLVFQSYDPITNGAVENDGFVDAWTHVNQDDGFTFPTCKPIKRIDFVLARNNSACAQDCFTSAILDTFIVGNNPTNETVHLVGSREGLGMNDEDSPIWASDHLAVISDFLLQ